MNQWIEIASSLDQKLVVNKSNIEIGYLNQYTPRKSTNTIEHILVAYFNF